MQNSNGVPPARRKLTNVEAACYTVPQLADLLICSERHVWRLVDEKAIPGMFRPGKLVRFAKTLVDEWIAQGCPPHGSADQHRPSAPRRRPPE
jgi:excisionase family DNA binding protein